MMGAKCAKYNGTFEPFGSRDSSKSAASGDSSKSAASSEDVQDCPGCRYRVREERLTKQLAIAIEAIEAWRGVNDYLSMTLEVVTNITKGFSEALESLNKGENHESSD